MIADARILVVDDEASNVRLLERLLEQFGYANVSSTTDSREAMALFHQLPADIVLLDLAMPAPDGMTIMRQIRSGSTAAARTPVLVLTADAALETKLQALAAGASDFLTKPFDITEVELRVRNLLEMRSLYSQLQAQNEALEQRVRERTRELSDAYDREKAAGDQLVVLAQVKDSFLMAVSHELRTPLTVLLGIGQTLERRLDDLPRESVRELVARLVASGRRLERLVSSLLDEDRIRRGLGQPMRRMTELRPLVERALEETDLKGHPLELIVDDASVEIDPAQVERMVDHLLANAIHHTPPGTAIRVEIASRDDELFITVDDEGPGVPDELKHEIFERFVQGTIPAHSPGLGLGLSLVAQFARLHGGRAWVEDRPGGGSSFRVRLPLPG